VDRATCLALLADPDPARRADGVKLLAGRPEDPVLRLRPSLPLTQDPDASVRLHAVVAIAELLEDVWLADLPDLQEQVVQALVARLADEARARVCEPLPGAWRAGFGGPVGQAAARALIGLGPAVAPAVPELRRLLREGHQVQQQRALLILRSIGPAAHAAGPEVAALLPAAVPGEGASPLAWDALRALLCIDAVEAADPTALQALTEHDAAGVRCLAWTCLAQLDPDDHTCCTRALQELVAMGRTRRGLRQRLASCERAALLRDRAHQERHLPELVAMLEDPDQGVRLGALDLLEHLDVDPELLREPLEQLSSDPRLFWKARELLRQLRSRQRR
jgi:hypothetical protein